jgi:hypothetical protein
MKNTSRALRPRVAEQKKIRQPIGRKREPSPNLTEEQIADWRGFLHALDEYNVGREGHDQLNPSSLARFAAPLGGSAYRQQWAPYIWGKIPMTHVDQLIFTLLVQTDLPPRPEKIFPSWPKHFSVVRQLPRKALIPLLVFMLNKSVFSQKNITPTANEARTRLAELFIATTPAQRDEIMHRALAAMPVPPSTD